MPVKIFRRAGQVLSSTKGMLFGRGLVLSTVSPLLTAENERGQLSFYDLHALARRTVARLLLLTGDRTAYS